ncbi:MAG: ABC transporter ATP-binding protein [Dehalococcoidia bacterium]
MDAIMVEGLTKTYRNGVQALAGVSFAVRQGEIFGLLGPNGAGKSTLLLTLALLQRPSAGVVLMNGEPVRGRERALRRRMAMVFQEPLLLDRTVRDNVLLGLRLRGVPAAERGPRADLWLERLGIGPLAGRRPHALSGGEAQRASLARALALEPETLFLDEPFAGLDAPTRAALLGDLARLLRRPGLTTLMVTHDRDEALHLADRALVLVRGRVRQTGPVEEVFSRPADPEVAAFVGVDTVVRGWVAEWDDGVAYLRAGTALVAAVHDEPLDGHVVVCIRPEDVAVAPPEAGERPSSVRNRLPGRVVELVPAGGQRRLTIDVGFPLVALITRRSAEELALTPGAQVVAEVKATAIHLIPTAAGEPSIEIPD